jgi:MFS family permease
MLNSVRLPANLQQNNQETNQLPIDTNSNVYRGLIIFACAVGMALGAPTFLIYSFGVFIEPLSEGLQTGRGAVSLALTFGLLGNLAAGPLVGMLSDRYGARRMVLIGVVALATVLLGFSLVQNIAHLYIAAILLVFLGAGTGPITYTRIISAWFNKRRGLAIGLALIGIGIGGTLAPIVSQALISDFGWRMAYRYLGLIVFVISFPVLFLILRDRPAVKVTDGEEAQPADVEEGYSVREAVRTRDFWFAATGFAIVAMGNAGGLVHMPPLLADAGLTVERAALYTGLLGVGVTIGRVLGGYLLDIFHAPYVAIGGLLGPFMAYSFFQAGFDPEWAFVPVLLFGIGMGAEFDVLPFLVTRYFGLKNFGVIYGIYISAYSIGTGLGPAIMGFGYDHFGHYRVSIFIAMGALIAGGILISRLGKYRFT